MPKLSVFPKAFMNELCVTGEMTLQTWVELAASLDVEGTELYCGMLDLQSPERWAEARRILDDHNLAMPMLCCSPDFTHPAAAFRQTEIDKEKTWIDLAAELQAQYCRVLSGQRRPEVSQADGIRYAAESIIECIPHAIENNITLILENHYKDGFWIYPEFAQYMDVFCQLVETIYASNPGQLPDGRPAFGVNYDPSNTILAGEDPLELLDRIKHRVVTMHASDRYLAEGTIEDLKLVENVEGYAKMLKHGEIGQGMNDYDAIFSTLAAVGFDGWVSIEDGVDGMEQLARSVTFLREKIAQHFPEK